MLTTSKLCLYYIEEQFSFVVSVIAKWKLMFDISATSLSLSYTVFFPFIYHHSRLGMLGPQSFLSGSQFFLSSFSSACKYLFLFINTLHQIMEIWWIHICILIEVIQSLSVMFFLKTFSVPVFLICPNHGMIHPRQRLIKFPSSSNDFRLPSKSLQS